MLLEDVDIRSMNACALLEVLKKHADVSVTTRESGLKASSIVWVMAVIPRFPLVNKQEMEAQGFRYYVGDPIELGGPTLENVVVHVIDEARKTWVAC